MSVHWLLDSLSGGRILVRMQSVYHQGSAVGISQNGF